MSKCCWSCWSVAARLMGAACSKRTPAWVWFFSSGEREGASRIGTATDVGDVGEIISNSISHVLFLQKESGVFLSGLFFRRFFYFPVVCSFLLGALQSDCFGCLWCCFCFLLGSEFLHFHTSFIVSVNIDHYSIAFNCFNLGGLVGSGKGLQSPAPLWWVSGDKDICSAESTTESWQWKSSSFTPLLRGRLALIIALPSELCRERCRGCCQLISAWLQKGNGPRGADPSWRSWQTARLVLRVICTALTELSVNKLQVRCWVNPTRTEVCVLLRAAHAKPAAWSEVKLWPFLAGIGSEGCGSVVGLSALAASKGMCIQCPRFIQPWKRTHSSI